jgi:hypothetical protein
VRRTKFIVVRGKTENCNCAGGSQTVPVCMSDRAGWRQGTDLRSDDIRLMGDCLGLAAGRRSRLFWLNFINLSSINILRRQAEF